MQAQEPRPKVTIITACFQSEETIAATVESVLSQTWPNIEYLVIDGGSRDQTLARIEPYRDRIAKIVSEKDQGIYDALNKGISLASGEIIGFLHSDDRFAHPRAVENLVKAVLQDQSDGVYSDLEYIRTKGSEESVLRHWRSEPFQSGLLARGWMPPHPTLYLKRKVYETLGGFDLRYAIAADYDFILRAFQRSDFRWSYLPEVTVQMRVGGASNRNFEQMWKKSREDFAILSHHGISPWFALFLKNISKIPQFLTRNSL
jgi:glycosyltransferase